jgi:4-amino-4-deoxy-L-arabinose transferase-like glycosyltransferase
VLIACALALRVALVLTWHVPAGDGHHYYQLAQQLATKGRLAYGDPPAPLQFTRLPGYPLFLAYVVRSVPRPMEAHLVRATLANVVLDLLSALLLVSVVRRLGARPAFQMATFAAVIFAPSVMLLASYGLTESLATFLAVAMLSCAAHYRLSKKWGWAVAAGVAAGAAQLVRVDALTLLPALGVLVVGAPLRHVAALALAGAVTFAPWPIRNQVRLGALYPLGAAWIAQDGRPQPTGMLAWMRSWSGGRRGEAYIQMLVSNRRPLDDRPGTLLPVMFDSPEERARLMQLFAQYNREHLSPAVDAGFRALARERAARRPFRHYVVLPLLRLWALWIPTPDYELPMRTPVLGLPAARPLFDGVQSALLLFGLLGLALAARVAELRRFALVVATALVVRTAFFSYFHPMPTQRYVVELIPFLMVFAVYAIARFRRPRPGAA